LQGLISHKEILLPILPVCVHFHAQAGAEIGQKGTLCKGLDQMVVIEHQAIIPAFKNPVSPPPTVHYMIPGTLILYS